MAFFDDYNKYKENHNLVDNFLIHIGALEYGYILSEVYIDTNHTLDGREGRAVAKGDFSYSEDISYINEIVKIECGLFSEGFDNEKYPDGIRDVKHYHELKDSLVTVLENSANDCTIELEDYNYDNYKRTFDLTFDFRGDMMDVDIINYWTYYAYVKVIMVDVEASYWCNLVVQAVELQKEEKYELALLVMFSAFDNLITLEIEKIDSLYYNEFNLETLEFGKKVSLLLKHHLRVIPSYKKEVHPVKDLIQKIYTKMYKLRNNVAHGKNREIEEDDFEECLNMIIFTYAAINDKPIDNVDLLRKIKTY